MSNLHWDRDVRGRPRPLDPDRPIWERQDGETNEAWRAFEKYRDQEHRNYREVSASAGRWSREWQWQARVAEWDRHLTRQEAEELVRYRVSMNQRQRAIARSAQSKIIQWLTNLDPSKMRPSEAARWFEIAVKVERDAAGVKGTEIVSGGVEQEVTDALAGLTLGELLKGEKTDLSNVSGLDDAEAAEKIYRGLNTSGANSTESE